MACNLSSPITDSSPGQGACTILAWSPTAPGSAPARRRDTGEHAGDAYAQLYNLRRRQGIDIGAWHLWQRPVRRPCNSCGCAAARPAAGACWRHSPAVSPHLVAIAHRFSPTTWHTQPLARCRPRHAFYYTPSTRTELAAVPVPPRAANLRRMLSAVVCGALEVRARPHPPAPPARFRAGVAAAFLTPRHPVRTPCFLLHCALALLPTRLGARLCVVAPPLSLLRPPRHSDADVAAAAAVLPAAAAAVAAAAWSYQLLLWALLLLAPAALVALLAGTERAD